MNIRILRIGDVAKKTGLSRRTIYRWISQGRFPEQLFLGNSRIVGWSEKTIDNWISTQCAQEIINYIAKTIMPKNTNLDSNNDLATFMRPQDKLKGWEERVLACNSKNSQDYRYNLHKDDAENLRKEYPEEFFRWVFQSFAETGQLTEYLERQIVKRIPFLKTKSIYTLRGDELENYLTNNKEVKN